MSTHAWESLSNQAVAAAGVIYFLALLSHLVEWSALIGRRSAVAERKVLVGPAGAESSVPSSTEAPVDSEGAVGTSGSSGEDERATRAELFGRLGYLLTCIAVACHVVAIASRGFAAGRVPWGNMYEFTLAGTGIVAAVYVLLYRRLKLSWMAPAVVAFVLVFLMVAVLVLYTPVEPLTEALNSYWLVIHVISAALATGAFTLGGIASAMYLLKRRRPDTQTGWMARVPDLPVLDRVAYRIHAFGFPIWTFAVLISGPIWAHQAWGSYWNWDPKEVWAFITWVVYAGYLHARATAGWKGRNAAILALVGVATLWFNFIGINYFSTTSMHSYAAPAHVAAAAPAVPEALR
ncbi:c-type cytochrome biogenesis protein CcsB [Nocardioides sp.]|jgi:cytochrome c-type biogenesis protein CcsB|uniref:c-type cytochrome biogenesis protein CcsB n=1 Tax=Nocardioides sp. TaxID=35761 RepID=UPI002CFF0964|nr:c-type cytochrome biogenesis protein CcsB [Nocardioides sp.]HVX55849.1 c-type cytochrome biogenesis protein CcsB [Nocardioides sp.]